MAKVKFDSDTSEAYEMYHMLLGFTVKYEFYNDTVKGMLKQLISQATNRERPLEAALSQFITQLDHINSQS